MDSPRLKNPQAIEEASFRAIEEELGPHSFSPAEFQVVRRVIHATADFEFARTLAFHPGAIAAGIAAIRAGRDLVVDVEMVKAGVTQAILGKHGGNVRCYISDPEVVEEAKAKGLTRAIVSMGKAAAASPGAIYAIGNAPTALFELLRLAGEGRADPALVIGVPVGFISAAESKEALLGSGLPHIACRGRKGGSPVAVAVCNALLRLSEAPAESPP